MVRRLALLVLLLLPAGLAADTFPSQERGFQAGKAFHVGDFDTVNLFNGNLVLTLPIGGSYPVGGGLSYGLTLVYNSNVWDYEQTASDLTQAIPSRRSNAGMGWRLSLGELLDPAESRVQQATTAGTQNRWFTYDNRGFLTSEQHPEKGASGNGTATYSNYDARGHARNKTDGPHNLTFTHDRAERPTQVTGNDGETLTTFTYGSSNARGGEDQRPAGDGDALQFRGLALQCHGRGDRDLRLWRPAGAGFEPHDTDDLQRHALGILHPYFLYDRVSRLIEGRIHPQQGRGYLEIEPPIARGVQILTGEVLEAGSHFNISRARVLGREAAATSEARAPWFPGAWPPWDWLRASRRRARAAREAEVAAAARAEAAGEAGRAASYRFRASLQASRVALHACSAALSAHDEPLRACKAVPCAHGEPLRACKAVRNACHVPLHAYDEALRACNAVRDACDAALSTGSAVLHAYGEASFPCKAARDAYDVPLHACSEALLVSNAIRDAHSGALPACNAALSACNAIPTVYAAALGAYGEASYPCNATRDACNEALSVCNAVRDAYNGALYACNATLHAYKGLLHAYDGPLHPYIATSSACNVAIDAYDAAPDACNGTCGCSGGRARPGSAGVPPDHTPEPGSRPLQPFPGEPCLQEKSPLDPGSGAYLQQGRAADAERVSRESSRIFQSVGVPEQGHLVVLLLKKALEQDIASASLIRRTARFLHRVEHDPKAMLV